MNYRLHALDIAILLFILLLMRVTYTLKRVNKGVTHHV